MVHRSNVTEDVEAEGAGNHCRWRSHITHSKALIIPKSTCKLLLHLRVRTKITGLLITESINSKTIGNHLGKQQMSNITLSLPLRSDDLLNQRIQTLSVL